MREQFSGARVWPIVVVLVSLTAVIPPVAARALAGWRIEQAKQTADAVGAMLGTRVETLRVLGETSDVVCGTGRMPAAAADAQEWLRSPVAATGDLASRWPADPWGSCFVVRVRSLVDNGAALIISAGPNGRIDTPFDATSPKGDDIASTVR